MSWFNDVFDVASGRALVSGMDDYVKGPERAAKAQQQAADRATDAQLEMFHQVRADQAPYRQIGYNALNALAAMQGLPQYYGQPSGDESTGSGNDLIFGSGGGRPVGPLYVGNDGNNYLFGFEDQPAGVSTVNYPTAAYSSGGVESPDYRFRLNEGENALNRMLSANGMRLSGAAVKQAMRYGQGMASQEYQNRFARLASLAGIGQGANNMVTQANQNTSNAIAQNYLGSGNAAAAGIMGQNQNMANIAGTVGTLALAFI